MHCVRSGRRLLLLGEKRQQGVVMLWPVGSSVLVLDCCWTPVCKHIFWPYVYSNLTYAKFKLCQILECNSYVILGVCIQMPMTHQFLLIMMLIFVESLVLMLWYYLICLLREHAVFAVTSSLTGNMSELWLTCHCIISFKASEIPGNHLLNFLWHYVYNFFFCWVSQQSPRITPYCILMNNSKNKNINNNWHCSRRPLFCTAHIFRSHDWQFTSVTYTHSSWNIYV